jgi:hypothetical protein
MMKIFVAATFLSLTTVALAEAPKPPTPAKELTDLGKSMTGTWKCKGSFFGPDGKKVDLAGTMKSASEMGGMWIHDTYDSTMAGMNFHFESYTTYDSKAKTFHRMQMESDGGMAMGDGKQTGSKLDYEMTTKGSMGDGQFRDHIDWSDAKAGVKATGEMSMDKGKTWVKVYEQTCTK